MGKSTISTGPFSIATLNYQRVNPHDYRYYSNCPQLRHGQNSSFRGSCGSGEVSEETCQVSNDLCFIYEYIYIYNNTMIIYIYIYIYIYISIPFGMIIPHGRAKHVRLEFFSPHS